jgi:peptide/nickel transport system substrate-binding protein
MFKFMKHAVLAAAVAFSTSAAFAGKADDTLYVGFGQQLQSLDNYYSPGREGFLNGFWIYDALTYRDPNTLEFKPSLATAWRQIDDLTMEFDIRQGVKFHNGEILTPEDVAFTINYVCDPKNKVYNQSAAGWIERAEVVAGGKVRIKAKVITPFALEYVSILAIYPEKYYKEAGKDGMGQKPIGTGPFKAERGPNNTVVYTRFDDYFAGSPKGKAHISKMIYGVVPDQNTQIAELITGKLDWAYQISDDQAERLKRFPNLQVVSGDTFRVAFISLDGAAKTSPDTPLKNELVRRAINHAIDRDGIVRNLMKSRSRVINSPCNPIQFGCEQDVTIYKYDVQKAKALMQEAGYANGFAIDIIGYRNRQVAEAIVGDLRAIGITANLKWLQYPAAVQKRRANEAPMLIDDWGSNSINDVAAILPPFFTNGVDDFAMDKAVAADIIAGGGTNEATARKAAYSKALKRIADQAYWVPLFTMPLNYAFSSTLDLPVNRAEIPEFYRAKWK